MLWFEIKKVFCKFKNRMAVVVLLVILAAVSMLTMNRVEYPESRSDNIAELNKAYARKQGFSGIAELINNAFSEWRDYDYFAIDNISAEEAKSVYARRISNLKQFLDCVMCVSIFEQAYHFAGDLLFFPGSIAGNLVNQIFCALCMAKSAACRNWNCHL